MRRRYKVILTLLALLCVTVSLKHPKQIQTPFADDDFYAIEIPEDFHAGIPSQEKETYTATIDNESYVESYLQGVVDCRFLKDEINVKVKNGQILLSQLPEDEMQAKSVVALVRSFSSIPATVPATEKQSASPNLVAVTTPLLAQADIITPKLEERLKVSESKGIWFPQSTIIFPTQIANPRQPMFSGGFRINSKACGGRVSSAVSLGDQFPLYRWKEMFKWKGDLQLELEACVFAVFCHDTWDTPMQNADYYVGVPVTYGVGPWAFRGRVYHISSHLGDEYMCDHRHAYKHRKNKSFEVADFFADYHITEQFRVYGGVGSVLHSDEQMHLKPLLFEYGSEIRWWRHNWTQLFGEPFFAVHLRNYQDVDYRTDFTCTLGYEWGKIQGYGRKVRLFAEYHNGFSPDGQFSRHRSNFYAIRLAYGF